MASRLDRHNDRIPMLILDANPQGLPVHHAALQLTGWLSERRGQTFVQHCPVNLHAGDRALLGSRVTLFARPRTDTWGVLNENTGVQRLALAPAHQTNGSRFCVLGQLRRVDPSEQMIIVRVLRNGVYGRHHGLRLRATTTVLNRVDPEWSLVQFWGSLVGRMMIVDALQPYARAPQGARWLDEWTLTPDVDLRAFPDLLTRPLDRHAVLRRSPAGRCYLNGRPFKREAFEALLKVGALWVCSSVRQG